jgi:hypothetical protein
MDLYIHCPIRIHAKCLFKHRDNFTLFEWSFCCLYQGLTAGLALFIQEPHLKATIKLFKAIYIFRLYEALVPRMWDACSQCNPNLFRFELASLRDMIWAEMLQLAVRLTTGWTTGIPIPSGTSGFLFVISAVGPTQTQGLCLLSGKWSQNVSLITDFYLMSGLRTAGTFHHTPSWRDS